MNTRRPISELVTAMLRELSSSICINPAMRTTPAFRSQAEKLLADFIQDWLDEDRADYVFKENVALYVCKLSSTNTHCAKVIRKDRGFSFLKRGDAFDFSHEGFHEAEGQGRIYQAASDFKHGRICADERYNPEI